MHPDEVFTALADGTRREVIWALAVHGGCTATQLAAGMPITRQAVAKHLTLLRHTGLVERERRGRETHYRLVPSAFDQAVAWLEDLTGQAAQARQAA